MAQLVWYWFTNWKDPGSHPILLFQTQHDGQVDVGGREAASIRDNRKSGRPEVAIPEPSLEPHRPDQLEEVRNKKFAE